MTFPSITGKILKVRMYLIDDLPVAILADIDMLKAFGYVFKDETPPFFKHPAQPEIELELKDHDDLFKIHNVTEFEQYQINKRGFQDKPAVNIIETHLHSRLKAGNKSIYVDDSTPQLFPDDVKDESKEDSERLTKSEIDYFYNKLRELKESEDEVNKQVNYLQECSSYGNCNVFYYQTPDLIDFDNIDTHHVECLRFEDKGIIK